MMAPRDLEHLFQLHQKKLLKKKTAVCELGSQQLNYAFFEKPERIKEFGAIFDVHAPLLVKPSRIYEEAPASRIFWEWLGFNYTAVDIDGTPGSIPLDLNFDRVPRSHCKRYDLVTNFGTTEHLCNQLNAFKAAHDLTAVGGVMMHALPTQGFFTHCQINYNVNFFWQLTRSNKYRWLWLDMDRVSEKQGLPDNIKAFMTPENIERFKDYAVEDCLVRVALQKVEDMSFVPPFDISTEVQPQTQFAKLKRNYWTVFNPNRKNYVASWMKRGRSLLKTVKTKLNN